MTNRSYKPQEQSSAGMSAGTAGTVSWSAGTVSWSAGQLEQSSYGGQPDERSK